MTVFRQKFSKICEQSFHLYNVLACVNTNTRLVPTYSVLVSALRDANQLLVRSQVIINFTNNCHENKATFTKNKYNVL